MSKKGGIIGAIGTVAGRLSELFSYGPKVGLQGFGPWAVDTEVIDPIGETKRQLPLDYIKMLGDDEIIPPVGLTKKAFIETLPKWARPAFRNTAYVGFVGPVHQDQIVKLQSERLQTPEPKEPDYSVDEIDFIVGGVMGYAAPDAPEELGPNFALWVNAHKKELSKIGGWEGILKTYGLEPTVQYGLGAPVQKRTFGQYRSECKE